MSIQGQGHFLTLAQCHLQIKTCFSQTPLGHFNQILYVRFLVHGNKNLPGHMTKMGAMPIYDETLREPVDQLPRNLVHVCSI